jgi:prepilin-type processing-associated H-X9-DG protein
MIPLSPDETDAEGNPIRFVYGVNWVEALYPYIMEAAKKTDRDWRSFMLCPNADGTPYPPTLGRMSYVINFNMLERSTAIVRSRGNTMIMREMDRPVIAMCRPNGDSVEQYQHEPHSPFLNGDSSISGVDGNLHGNGSYIVFADGHISYFTLDYYPNDDYVTEANCVDPVSKQWFNYYFAEPANDTQRMLNKSIAITP